jgi:hypothetical protein
VIGGRFHRETSSDLRELLHHTIARKRGGCGLRERPYSSWYTLANGLSPKCFSAARRAGIR